MNQTREYWYIGSMLAKSEIQKNRIEACVATGRYPFLVWSISNSVAAATSCLAEISAASFLEDDRTLIAVSSSRIFPW